MSKKVMLRNVRLSYEHIFTPTKFDDNQEAAKYSATFIIPKDHQDVATLKRTLVEAGKETFPSDFNGNGWPKGYTCGLKDADKDTDSNGEILAEKNPAYKGCYIIEANSVRRPLTINRNKAAVTEEDGIIYSGCYVNASLGIAGYTYGKVKKGVKAYLNGVQFVADGDRFGSDAMSDFDELDEAGGDDEFDFMA